MNVGQECVIPAAQTAEHKAGMKRLGFKQSGMRGDAGRVVSRDSGRAVINFAQRVICVWSVLRNRN